MESLKEPLKTAHRQKRTVERLQIVYALDCLCDKRPLNDISVKDICKDAGISRSAFYRLFADKYDVANWYTYLIDDLGITQIGRTLTWIDAHRTTASGCYLMKNLVKSAWRSPEYYGMYETGFRYRRDCLIDTLVNYKHVSLTEDLRFQVEFYAQAESYTGRNWFLSDDSGSIDDYARKVEKCVPLELYELIIDPVDPKPPINLTLQSLLAGRL